MAITGRDYSYPRELGHMHGYCWWCGRHDWWCWKDGAYSMHDLGRCRHCRRNRRCCEQFLLGFTWTLIALTIGLLLL